jgi:lamin tail-like protein
MISSRRIRMAAAATALASAGALVVPATQADAAVSPVRFIAINYDPPGKDTRTPWHLNQEWIQVRNFGSTPRSLAGWRVRDAANHTFVFPAGFVLKAHSTVTIRTGKGRNTTTTLYWQQGNYIWNNTGDNARLQTPVNTVIDRCAYKQWTGRVRVAC